MSSILLVTLIVLLADGSPGKYAYLSCPAIDVARVGSDTGELMPRGTSIALDSRGAAIVQSQHPTTLTCHAVYADQMFSGPVNLTREQKIVRIKLEVAD
jgi:hypothetical protein